MLTENIKTIQTDDSPFDDEFQARFFIGLEKMKKMRGHQTQEASRATENQWHAECLSTLARKWELAEELVHLESSCLSMKGTLQEYQAALRNAIVDRVKGKSLTLP
ncbi:MULTISPECIES: hypothetical protein [Pasteurellaceae]|uniref:hypothetical protein n=1 Tax=Pasteurellaceae TaxID=712 RepID=UPI0005096CDD|nr:hypothetical protein AUSP0112_00004 [uncultured phage]